MMANMSKFVFKIEAADWRWTTEERNAFFLRRITEFLKTGHVVEEISVDADKAVITCSKVDFNSLCESMRMTLSLSDPYDEPEIRYGDSVESRCFFDIVAPFIKKMYNVEITHRPLVCLFFNKGDDFIECIFGPNAHKTYRLSFSLIEQGLDGCDEFLKQIRIGQIHHQIKLHEAQISKDTKAIQVLVHELRTLE